MTPSSSPQPYHVVLFHSYRVLLYNTQSYNVLDLVVFGKHIYLTVIARRSNKYAGPRFLKRGSNPRVNITPLPDYILYS